MKSFSLSSFLCLSAMLIAGTLNAQSLKLQRLQPYGWQDVAEGTVINLGTASLGHPLTKSAYRVVGADLTAEVVASFDNEAFTLTQETDGENTNLTVTFMSNVEIDEVVSTLTVSSEGAASIAYQFKASAKDLNCASLADMKNKAKEVNDNNVDLYYTGKAVVSHIEGNMVFLADETGSALVTVANNTDVSDLKPGICVNFVARGYNISYDWISFYQATITTTGSVVGEWKSPLRENVTALPAVTQTGSYVRMTGVTVNAPEVVTAGIPGIYEWTETYYSCTDAEGNKINLYLPDSNPYYNGLPYDEGTAVELIGVVYPYSRTNGMPTSFIIPTCIRPAVPEVTLPLGAYNASGENLIYDNYPETWVVNLSADENDPYRYWFDYLIPSYAGCLISVYGDLSADGKTLSVPTGFERGDGFLSLFDPEDGHAAAKGTMLVADVAEDGSFTFRDAIGLSVCFDYSDFGIGYIWGSYGGEAAGATFSPVIPLPVVADLKVEAQGYDAVLSWSVPELHPSQELIGFRIYCNGDVAGECDAETTSYVQENLREGEYTYYVTCLVNEEESAASNIVTITISESTGISNIKATPDAMSSYNLYGTRTRENKPGMIYIQSGRKLLSK